MNYKPTHNVIDPFSKFSAEEIHYYTKRARLLRAVALPEISQLTGQLFGDRRRFLFHRATPAITQTSTKS